MGSRPPCPIIPIPKRMDLALSDHVWPAAFRVVPQTPQAASHVHRFAALRPQAQTQGDDAGECAIPVRLVEPEDGRAEAYSIDLANDSMTVAASDDSGFRYAACTLAALVAQDRRLVGRIEDWPRLPVRGFHLNFAAYSRLDADQAVRLMETAARFKLNTVLIEYGPRFPFSAGLVPPPSNRLTQADVRRIVDAAAGVGLNVIPLQQSLAHLEYILSNPAYAALREGKDRNNLLCPSNPHGAEFVRTLAGEVIQAHPAATWMHLGGDEARKVGRCPACAAAVRKDGVGGLYGRYMGDLARWVLEQGRRPIVWDDTLCAHPDAIPHLPKETIIAYWDYIAVADPTPVLIPRMSHAAGGPRVAHHQSWLSPRRRKRISDVQRRVMRAYSQACHLNRTLGRPYLQAFRRYLGDGFPTWVRALPYLEYYRDRGHDVLCCPTGLGNGDTRDGVPNYSRFEANIRTHGERAASGGAIGVVTTAWYDMPPEVLVQPLIHTAQNTW